MDKQHHIIGRTVLELDTGQLADLWSLQEDVSHLFQQQALPEIERLFDRLVSNEEVVRLDRVVVEIPPVDSRFLEDEFVEKLLEALNQTLSDRLEGRMPVNTDNETITQDRSGADWEVLLYFLEYGRLPWWCLAEDWTAWLPRWKAVMEGETAWRSPLRQLLSGNRAARQRLVMQLPEAFRHQLVLQLQPAWTDWPNLLVQARWLMQGLNLGRDLVQKLEQQAWLLLLAEISPNNTAMQPFPANLWIRTWLHQLVKIWQSETPRATELPLPPSGGATPVQLSPQTSTATISRSKEEEAQQKQDEQPVADSGETAPQVTHQRLRALIEANPSAESHLWLAALKQVLPLTSTNTTSPLASPTAQVGEINSSSQSRKSDGTLSRKRESPSLESEETDDSLPKSAPEATALSSVPKEEDGDVDTESASKESSRAFGDRPIVPTGDSTPGLNPNLPLVGQGSQELSEFLDMNPLINLTPRRESGSGLSPVEEKGGLYVTQAGLVLLHQFLCPYLDAVGLLEEESFRDELAQQTAIYLLYYLGTKQTDAPEYDLVLPKLLCGWPLNEPVVRDLDLLEADLAEGENLLQSAIDHWQALKSTGPDGLREGFLQRDGKLTRTDSGWKLQVEQKVIDILLSRLPWGLSMVKLPWMEEILIVEWT